MSSIKPESIQEFILIAGDNVSLEEAEKYLKMGKGNMEAALNYFFNKKDKAPKPSEPEKPRNIFEQLNEGSKNQAKVEKIIKELRKDYSRPIQPTSNPSSTKKVPDLKVTPYPNMNIEKKSSSDSVGSASKPKAELSLEAKKPIMNDQMKTPNKESSIKGIGSTSKISVEKPLTVSQISSAVKSVVESKSVQNLSEKFEKIGESVTKIDEEDDIEDFDFELPNCKTHPLP